MRRSERLGWILLGTFAGLVMSTNPACPQETVSDPVRQFSVGTMGPGAYSPDGGTLVLGEGPEAYMWDVEAVTILQRFSGHTGILTSVVYSPDGTRLLTGSGDTTARLWDAATGRTLFTFAGHTGAVTAVAFAPDGRSLLTGSADRTACLWDSLTGELLYTFEGHSLGVTSVTYSPDGDSVLTSSWDKILRLWDFESGDQIRTYDNRMGPAVFSPDGSTILAASDPNLAVLMDRTTGEALRPLAGHGAPIASLAFSPAGTEAVTGSWDWTAKVWNVATGDLGPTLSGHGAGVQTVAFSPDNTRILTVASTPDNTARLWETSTGTRLHRYGGHFNDVRAVAFSPDGSHVFLGQGFPEPVFTLWDSTTGQLLRVFRGHNSFVNSLAIFRDGSRILSGSSDGTVRAWNIPTGEVLFTAEVGYAAQVALSPDGTRFVALPGEGNTNRVDVWDAHTGILVRAITGPGISASARTAAFSPTGHRVATGWSLGLITIHDVQTGQLLRTLEVNPSEGLTPVYSPDGTRLVSASSSGNLTLWDANTFEPIRSFQTSSSWGLTCVAFSPDGRYILTGHRNPADGSLWDAESGTLVRTFQGPEDSSVSGVAFSPDGTRVLTGVETTGLLWDSGLSPFLHAPLRFDFSDTKEAWRFVSAPQFEAPTASVLPGEPGGLVLRGHSNTLTFGLWESPLIDFGDQITVVKPTALGANGTPPVYSAEFLVRSAVPDRARVPQVRLRVTSEDFQQTDFLAVESRTDGLLSPDTHGTSYTLVFTSSLVPFHGRLAFDLLNFDPSDDPRGDLQLDSVRITRQEVRDLGPGQVLADFTFDSGGEGWTIQPIPGFTAPEFGTEPGALTVRGVSGATQVFGFWSSPEVSIDPPLSEPGLLPSACLLRATFEVESDLPTAQRVAVPQFRLRLNESTLHAGAVQAIESKGNASLAPATGEPRAYTVYFRNPASSEVQGVRAAFDFLNFDPTDTPAATLRLHRVIIESLPGPW